MMPGEWIGVILDGKGETFGWVGQSPVTGMHELVEQRWDARTFDASGPARLAASKLLAALSHDPVYDLYQPVAVEAEVRV